MNPLKNRIKNILWKYWMYRGMRSLKQIGAPADNIAQAIRETIFQTVMPEEQTWINLIERIREKFTGNPEQVEVIDFGAGNPDSQRSDKEMKQGVAFTTTYGDIALGSKPAIWALLLFKLIRIIQPELAIELGTCIGISAAYQSAAQKLNGKGRLITIEGSEAIAALARKNIESFQLNNVEILSGTFNDILPGVFAKTSAVDYVFIDGHHDEQATIAYFELFLPYLSSGAVVVFDDISWSKGMRRAWKKISEHPNVDFAIDLTMIGICRMK